VIKRATGRKRKAPERIQRKHDRAGNGPASSRVATTPVLLKVQKILQSSHRQKTAASGRAGSPGVAVCLLREADLNFSALKNSVTLREPDFSG
jgi:hypothetical protein